MARRNPTPTITQTEILAFAGQHILREIHKLKKELDGLAAQLGTNAPHDLEQMYANIEERTNEQIAYHRKKLEAIETMYRIETGTDLGLIDEI